MKNAAEDQVKRDRGGAAAHTEPPQPTRRQLLKGLTTGTVAIGLLGGIRLVILACGFGLPLGKPLVDVVGRTAERLPLAG